jgi:3-oxoacyl-[acyl-carrier-protein] synthase II
MLRRVVVTGVGVVGAGLVGGGETLRRWLAEAPSAPADHAVDDTLLAALMDGADARRASRVSRFTIAATRLSLADAGLDDASAAGFVLGTEHGDLHSAIEFAEGFLRGGPAGVSALAFPNTVMNTMASAATIACATRGPALTLNVRTVGGELAVARAAHTIASGRLEVALAGGADVRNRTVEATLAELGAGSEIRGEGATVLVLESLDHARARGASPLGEILGAAWRGLPARPNGVGRAAASRAVAGALAEAGLPERAITWAYSSANGDAPRDDWERALLARALGREVTTASLAGRLGQHAGLGALRVAAAAWSATSGRLVDPPMDVAPGPGLVHGVARGGSHVALVVGPAPDGVAG